MNSVFSCMAMPWSSSFQVSGAIFAQDAAPMHLDLSYFIVYFIVVKQNFGNINVCFSYDCTNSHKIN